MHRANLLDARVKKLVAQGGVTRASLAQAMEDAAVTDLRGEDVLPDLLQVLDSQPITDPQLAADVAELQNWQRRRQPSAGRPRRARTPTPTPTRSASWTPGGRCWSRPSSSRGSATDLYNALTASLTSTSRPRPAHGPTGSHAGSSFQYGWWSYVDKDLRAVLGKPVAGGLARTYCGDGSLAACRTALLSTLQQAAAGPAGPGLPG